MCEVYTVAKQRKGICVLCAEHVCLEGGWVWSEHVMDFVNGEGVVARRSLNLYGLHLGTPSGIKCSLILNSIRRVLA